MQELSRAALYELVWSKPMTEIARDLNVRDQHVAVACDLFDIVRPRAGHWQKVGHGKPVEKGALSTTVFSADEIVPVGV
jgi:hypothetical protein